MVCSVKWFFKFIFLNLFIFIPHRLSDSRPTPYTIVRLRFLFRFYFFILGVFFAWSLKWWSSHYFTPRFSHWYEENGKSTVKWCCLLFFANVLYFRWVLKMHKIFQLARFASMGFDGRLGNYVKYVNCVEIEYATYILMQKENLCSRCIQSDTYPSSDRWNWLEKTYARSYEITLTRFECINLLFSFSQNDSISQLKCV